MITFEKVRYKNFLSTGNVFTEVELNRNKNTLIIGENGAGKSTVLEAISYALYGKAMRNINKPQLVNSITQKNMLVEIEFKIGEKEYLVRRGQKPAIFEIVVNGNLLNQDSKAYDYQEQLETQILKMNHKSFIQIDVLSVTNYVPFMKLPAAGRREVIEDLLDIQIFSVMNTLLKERISANKSNLQDAEYQIKLAENKIEMHKRHLREMAQNNKSIIEARQTKKKEYEEDNAQLFAESESVKSALTDTQGLGKEKEAAQSAHKTLCEQHKKARAIRTRSESELSFYTNNTNCPTCKQELAESFKTSEMEKRARIILQAEESIPKLEAKIQKAQEVLDEFLANDLKERALSKQLSELNIRINTNLQFIKSLEEDIAQLEAKIQKTKVENVTTIELQDELNNANTKKEDYIQEREILNMASQLLKDGGIKTRIIKQYIPIMNKLINKYLAAMDFFVQFELDETFKETIKSRFRDEFSYDSFSQGEKLRIDLALLFTWRAIAKLRNSSSSNLLFMDEILDSSLDSGGVEEFLKIINNLTGDTNVFIISHRGDQMLDKFDNVIRFEKHRNFSRIAE